MSKLCYLTNISVDGYIEDSSGSFDWGYSVEVHAFFTELIKPIGTYLYGRRLYEKMAYWDRPLDHYSPEHLPFAQVWQRAQKIVFSRTLTSAATGHTRMESTFEPESIEMLKQQSSHDISIGGAEIAEVAIEANLVDECHLVVHPVIVGRGKPAFPPALRRQLELLGTRSFSSGAVYLRYAIRAASSH